MSDALLPNVPHPNAPGNGYAWDLWLIAGEVGPGLIRVDIDPERALDKQKRKKHNGADFKDNGYPGAPMTITIRLWTQDDYNGFYRRILPLLHPRKPDASISPLAFDYIQTRLLGVEAIIVTGLSFKSPEGGIQTITIKADEWIAKPVAVKAKPGTLAGSGQPSYDSSDRFGNDYYDTGTNDFKVTQDGDPIPLKDRDAGIEDGVFNDVPVDFLEGVD